MASERYLPSKLSPYLKRMALEYARTGDALLHEIVTTARTATIEDTDADNSDGITYYGHTALLFLSPQTMGQISFANQRKIAERLLDGLRVCSQGVQGEYFHAVRLELEDEDDPLFQRSGQRGARAPINPDTLSIWRPGYIRMFISHRDAYRVEARALADALEPYGIAAFVAHETIEPMSTWQQEILKGLETMEIMLVFGTDDFHDSIWANQEVGYALGHEIPIIPVKFGTNDPAGFIGSIQAMRGHLDDPQATAYGVRDIVAEKLGHQGRINQALITAFAESPNFNETISRFDRMESSISRLTDDEVEQIRRAFKDNYQLYGCIYLNNNRERLRKFLESCTGASVQIKGRDISVETEDDKIPF